MTLLLLPACQKMQRHLHETAPSAERRETAWPQDPQHPETLVKNPYEGNSYAVTEGQRLYNWYNCVGCHARGGGGIGPALMDNVWIYGRDPADLYSTIVGGRPNGMPAWRGKIPDFQVWQIVSYLQVINGDRSITAPPGPREEHIQAGEGVSSR